jgi:hypothetical protein
MQAAERRARHQRIQPSGQPPYVERVEAVDVLGGIERGDHPRGIDFSPLVVLILIQILRMLIDGVESSLAYPTV